MERAGKKERTRISQDIITSNTQYEVMGLWGRLGRNGGSLLKKWSKPELQSYMLQTTPLIDYIALLQYFTNV